MLSPSSNPLLIFFLSKKIERHIYPKAFLWRIQTESSKKKKKKESGWREGRVRNFMDKREPHKTRNWSSPGPRRPAGGPGTCRVQRLARGRPAHLLHTQLSDPQRRRPCADTGWRVPCGPSSHGAELNCSFPNMGFNSHLLSIFLTNSLFPVN